MEMLGPLTIPSIIFMVIVGVISWVVIKIAEIEEKKLKIRGQDEKSTSEVENNAIREVKVIYGTTTGKARSFALSLTSELAKIGLQASATSAADYDVEANLASEAENVLVILIFSTYTEGTPPEDAKWFYQYLKEAAGDFRTQHSILKVKTILRGVSNK